MIVKSQYMKHSFVILLFCLVQTSVLPENSDNSSSRTAEEIQNLKSDIMYAQMRSISDPNESFQKKQMSDLMKYIQLLDIPRVKTKPEKKTTAELIESIEPVTFKKEEVKTTVKNIDNSLEPQQIINLTLKDRPDKIINSFALAEVLYLKNDHANAVKFYERALKETIKSREPEKRAWILFQIANCYKLDDPVKSMAYFDQVAAEFPEYQLTPIASVQKEILKWQQDNKPSLTLEKYIGDPNSL